MMEVSVAKEETKEWDAERCKKDVRELMTLWRWTICIKAVALTMLLVGAVL